MNPAAFSSLTICGLDELEGHGGRGVTHVLSLMDPGWPEPAAFHDFAPHRRAAYYFHDVIEAAPDVVLPQAADVEAILAFGREVGDDPSHLLVHCHAGISRSTAATLMILAQAFDREDEDALAARLQQTRPQAWPNSRMIGFADERLGRGGRLSEAVRKIHARRLAARPELADVMRQLGRGREVQRALANAGTAPQ